MMMMMTSNNNSNNSNSNNNDDDNDNNNSIKRRDSRYFIISSLRHHLSQKSTFKWPGRYSVQIMCNASSAYDMQHIVCHVVQRDSSAIKFDRVEITFAFALFYWLNY